MSLPHPESTQTLSVLFVDDEQNVLDGLRRAMHDMRREWTMTFASSGAQALHMMQQSPPDVVVSDMRMPGMSGRDLLMEVKRLYPQAVRFILSGYAETSSVMQVAGTAHQYLAKPCECVALKAAIARTFSLRDLLHDKDLLQRVGRVDTLPSLPSIYQEIVSCLQGPEPVIADVARIISCDVVMTTMVLKLANSAFFGARQTFRSAGRAVSFLGLNTIAGLVLAHSIFNEFAITEKLGLSLEEIWHHSLKTATNARALARSEKWAPERVEEAFLAGVLHDVGKIVLATRAAPLAEPLGAANDNTMAFWHEHHAAVGAYLLGLWGFSDSLVEAIAFHHTPSRVVSAELGLPGLLHIADQLAHHPTAEDAALGKLKFEVGYLESLDLTGRLDEWRAICADTSS